MYTIRSSISSSFKRKGIELEKLGKFQYYINYLIGKLIDLSISHETKDTILKEIDDVIMAAY